MSTTPANPPILALAGNPNAGKTTLFNRLTGSRQHTGNYPGVTVEKKEGTFRHDGCDYAVVDLPGTYSLTAATEDERVARKYILYEKPRLVVDVVDSSNLERNLYLGVQLMELGAPAVIALNMSDVADERGVRIDTALLSKLFGVEVVRISAAKNTGIEELKNLIARSCSGQPPQAPAAVRYGEEIDREIDQLAGVLDRAGAVPAQLPVRWTALKLIEGDEEIRGAVASRADAGPVLEACDAARERIRKAFKDDAGIVIAERRYGFISGACREAVAVTVTDRHDLSDRIDELMTHRLLGLPIFFGLMYLMFKLVFTVGEPPMQWIEMLFGWIGRSVAAAWPASLGDTFRSLVVDGVIAGVGGVVVFFPNIVFLFLGIALLEDSGYMARAAFLMDRLMHRIGLHGKSFIPMLIGFGCTVPAILATRALESRRDRLITMLILPLISCGARLPIYALFLSAFFPPAWRTPLLMLIYLVGMLLAVVVAKILDKTVFRDNNPFFVMELPPYRMPTAHALFLHTWQRSKQFLRKAGTVVLGISILLWAITSFPRLADEKVAGLSGEAQHNAQLSHSVAGRVGHALEPVMRHVGFDWKASTALIGALAAKEVFVAQLGILNSVSDSDAGAETLRESLRRQYSRLQAFCIMLFCLISTPCVMTVAATRQESGSWGWALAQLFGLTLLAYAVTFLVYWGGSLIVGMAGG